MLRVRLLGVGGRGILVCQNFRFGKGFNFGSAIEGVVPHEKECHQSPDEDRDSRRQKNERIHCNRRESNREIVKVGTVMITMVKKMSYEASAKILERRVKWRALMLLFIVEE